MTRVESPQHVEEYNSLHATSDCADVALDRCHDPARPKIATGCVTPGRSIRNNPYLTRAEIMDLVWWHIKSSRRLPSIPTVQRASGSAGRPGCAVQVWMSACHVHQGMHCLRIRSEHHINACIVLLIKQVCLASGVTRSTKEAAVHANSNAVVPKSSHRPASSARITTGFQCL